MSTDPDAAPERVTAGVTWEPDSEDRAAGPQRRSAPGDVPREDLRAALAAVEAVEWAAVPGVSAATAAAFATACRQALDAPGGDPR